MNVALWIVQGFVAFAFIAGGAMKLFAYEKYKTQSEKNGPTGITRGLAAFIGIAEIAGGLGVVLPMATNIAPWLAVRDAGKAVDYYKAAFGAVELYRLDGNRLYYLNSYRGLMVFDVSDPDHPRMLGRSPIFGNPAQYTAFIQNEYTKWAKVIKAAGIKGE